MDLSLDTAYADELLDRISSHPASPDRTLHRVGRGRGVLRRRLRRTEEPHLLAAACGGRCSSPGWTRLFAPFRSRGLPIIMHSDGQIQQILPDLVEIGLTVLESGAAGGVGPRLAGGDVSGAAGLLRRRVHADDAALRHAGRGAGGRGRVRTPLAPAGTGLLLAPSHRMMTDIPMAQRGGDAGSVSRSDAPHSLTPSALSARSPPKQDAVSNLPPERTSTGADPMNADERKAFVSLAFADRYGSRAVALGTGARPRGLDGQPHGLQRGLRDDDDG